MDVLSSWSPSCLILCFSSLIHVVVAVDPAGVGSHALPARLHPLVGAARPSWTPAANAALGVAGLQGLGLGLGSLQAAATTAALAWQTTSMFPQPVSDGWVLSAPTVVRILIDFIFCFWYAFSFVRVHVCYVVNLSVQCPGAAARGVDRPGSPQCFCVGGILPAGNRRLYGTGRRSIGWR